MRTATQEMWCCIEVLEDFGMETIYFLMFVGVCVVLAIWAMNKPGKKTNLASRSPTTWTGAKSDKLAPPLDSRLAHKEEIWALRRKHASEGIAAKQSFIPKSAGKVPEYDGYSRRDRHHVTAKEHIKDEAHIGDAKKPAVSSAGFKPGRHATQN